MRVSKHGNSFVDESMSQWNAAFDRYAMSPAFVAGWNDFTCVIHMYPPSIGFTRQLFLLMANVYSCGQMKSERQSGKLSSRLSKRV